MKIVMFTNTYLPHVGGVAKSVKTLEDDCRARGHDVKVVAPDFEGADDDPDVLRVPAIQKFNGSDFSVRLPSPAMIYRFIDEFQPDIIHSHHPFLLGDAALRVAHNRHIPLVFTHHTLYERYTHYVPMDSDALKRVAIQLSTEYANLCSHVIAPSESIGRLIAERGVDVPVSAIPTGIPTSEFARADGAAFRERHGIPRDAVVIGHVGRLAPEKNLGFLARALGRVTEHENVWVLVVGDGPSKDEISGGLPVDRTTAPGSMRGNDLTAAYAAMDLFVFASQTETQGMVVAEAMSAGLPVVALDGPGVREIVSHDRNGLLLPADASEDDFTQAVLAVVRDPEKRRNQSAAARETSAEYDRAVTTDKVLQLYHDAIRREPSSDFDDSPWDTMLSALATEWELGAAKLSAISAAVVESKATEAKIA